MISFKNDKKSYNDTNIILVNKDKLYKSIEHIQNELKNKDNELKRIKFNYMLSAENSSFVLENELSIIKNEYYHLQGKLQALIEISEQKF